MIQARNQLRQRQWQVMMSLWITQTTDQRIDYSRKDILPAMVIRKQVTSVSILLIQDAIIQHHQSVRIDYSRDISLQQLHPAITVSIVFQYVHHVDGLQPRTTIKSRNLSDCFKVDRLSYLVKERIIPRRATLNRVIGRVVQHAPHRKLKLRQLKQTRLSQLIDVSYAIRFIEYLLVNCH